MEVEADAGPGAFNDEFGLEKARWRIPDAMIRHEGDAEPGALRIADAILDRLVHNAYKLKLKGGSMRKKKTSSTQPDH